MGENISADYLENEWWHTSASGGQEGYYNNTHPYKASLSPLNFK